MSRTVVIGIDGASWNIIERISKGVKLSNIQLLKENGCFGNLEWALNLFKILQKKFPLLLWRCING